MALRRTKDQKLADGQPMVHLPPKRVTVELVDLSHDDRERYVAGPTINRHCPPHHRHAREHPILAREIGL
jgi:hypothetical protein